MNHFTRLIDLTSADEQYIVALATSLAPCILRPRTETSLTMEEKHAYRLIRDLFQHKDAIFSELKRMSTLNHSSSVSAPRPRAISTDESNRRAHMEERQRALLEKAGGRSRATSPAPSPRHRRDRSVGGPETRFPIQTSPTSASDRHRASMASFPGGIVKRSSLEVPDNTGTAPAPASEVNGANGEAAADDGSVVEKRNSLGRSSARPSSARFERGRRVTVSKDSAPPAAIGEEENTAPESEAAPDSPSAVHSVTLTDKPMDD